MRIIMFNLGNYFKNYLFYEHPAFPVRFTALYVPVWLLEFGIERFYNQRWLWGMGFFDLKIFHPWVLHKFCYIYLRESGFLSSIFFIFDSEKELPKLRHDFGRQK